jgi:hypothetical protein
MLCLLLCCAVLWMMEYDVIDIQAFDKTIKTQLITTFQSYRSICYYNVVIILCIGNGFSGDRHHD